MQDREQRQGNGVRPQLERTSERGIAPGKVTRTMRLQQSAAAPVQRKPAAGNAQPADRGPVEDWTLVAIRPDLHQEPIMRESMSEIGYADVGASTSAPVQAKMEPGAGSPAVQMQDANPDHMIFGRYAEPYASSIEATAAETYLENTLLPASAAMFGTEVFLLWSMYLARAPGASLAPMIYNEDSSGIAFAFKHCADIRREQNSLLQEVIDNIKLAPPLPANEWTTVPLATFIGATPRELSTNFGNPYDTPGHIAGGIGGSDAGPDQRFVEGNVRLLRMTDENGVTKQILVEPDFHFRVIDAVDFIPGNPGTGLEQNLTIPLSRLEATGWAYDVPFQVNFTGPVDRRAVAGSVVARQYPANPAESPSLNQQRDQAPPSETERSRERLGTRDDSRRRDF